MRPLRRYCTVAAIILLAACATSPPVQEMSNARQAIAAAKDAGAERYAADELQMAEELLGNAERHLQQGTSSGYWQAKQSAVSAKEVAFDALLKSRTARDRATGTD